MYWVNMRAYQMIFDNSIVISGGGEEDLKDTALVIDFVTKNKNLYYKYETLAKVEYNEIVTFGKYQGKSVEDIKTIDVDYLKWMRDKYTFNSTQEKLKKEITEILK